MRDVVASRLAYVATALAVLVWAPVDAPPPHVAVVVAVVTGGAAGTLAFLVLARRLPPVPHGAVARAVMAATPVVAVAAACEEIVWRFGALGGLRAVVGTFAACAVSTIGFAAAHVGRAPPRALLTHLVTGTSFAGAYVATGRLAAPIAAHVLYNLLVVAACAAWVEPLAPRLEPVP